MWHKQIEKAKQWIHIFVLLMASFSVGPVFANKAPLPADKAFILSVSVENPQQVRVQWQIASGYYLYRKHMHFTFTPSINADILLPKGQVKQDLNHGEYEVYSGNLIIPVLLKTNIQSIQLNLVYQGCSEQGFCYPPIHKTLNLNMGKSAINLSVNSVNNVTEASWQSLLTDQNKVNALLDSQSFATMLLIFAGLGLLLAFTPCVLPMIPILTSIIVGHKQPVNSKKALLLSSIYVLGSSLTYACAGLLAAYMGGSLQAWLQQPALVAVVSCLFVLLSFSLFGFYDLRLPNRWQNRITSLSRKQQGGTYTGVFIMGMVSTLIVSPCVTAPLVGVLMYIAQTGNLLLGASALFVMSLGMGIPLIIIGVSAGKWLPKRGPWMNLVQYLFGILMFAMAMWLLSRVFSTATIMVFCSAIFICTAFFFILYSIKASENSLLYKRAGIVSASLSILLMMTVMTSSFTNHFLNKNTLPFTNSFTIVKNMDELNHQLSLARLTGKPVILDFYADWCESCVAMDKKNI